MNTLKSSLEVMSQDEVLMVHKSALQILARTGFHMPNDICLKRCEKAGAQIDYVNGLVRMPQQLTETLIDQLRHASAPRSNDVSKLTGGISTQVFVTDYRSQTRRYGVSNDVMKGISLVQHLNNIPYCNAVTVPSDVDPRLTDLHSYNLLMKYSVKHGGTYILSKETAHAIIDMSEVLGRKAFYLFESVSPLRFRKETLEMGLIFADRGHLLGIGPMIMGGMSGPMTLAGTLTLIVAEVLASIFSVYALSGQLNPYFGHGSHTNDPRTMICSFGSPNQALIAIGSAQMARFYGIPGGSNSGLSDALMPDFQCGFEKTLSSLLGSLAGAANIGCQGIAGADQGFSFEQLVIDNEWLDAYNYVISGFDVNEETIAEELIHSIGIGGNFIAEEHTVGHIHDSWWPSNLFRRDDFDNWLMTGAKDVLKLAHERVESWVSGYQTMSPVIGGDACEELDRIYEQTKMKIFRQ